MRGCRGLPRAAGHEGGASLREMSEIRGPPLEPGDFFLGRILSGFPRSFLPLAVCPENTCPLLPGTLVPSLGLAFPPPPRTPPGSGPSVWGGGVFFPGVPVPSRSPATTALFAGREPSLAAVPPHCRVEPRRGDPCFLGFGLARAPAVPELQ